MKAAPQSLEVPYTTQVVEQGAWTINRVWGEFFRIMQARVSPLGYEQYFTIVNNQAVDADIDGLIFDKAKVGQAAIDYVIQRVTTGGGATELIETGTFYAAYKPTSDDWVLSSVPSTAGVTLAITSAGQVTYTSSSVSGTAWISKITFRARTLAAKNAEYSRAGA
jgi:hypothetical protein